MNKFIGEILVLLGSMGLIVVSAISVGTIIFGIINNNLDVLVTTSYLIGWIALSLTLFSKIYSFIYSVGALRLISKGRSNKKTIFLSLIFAISEVSRDIYIFRNVSDFYAKDMFISLIIATSVLYLIQIIGCILNYKKTS